MKDIASTPLGLRPPDEVMTLERLGASFPTRLSFLRSLIRQLHAEGARVTRPVWQMNADGHGHAVYAVPLGGQDYSLIAFSQPLAPEDRTDRVIAEAWDTTFALFDGVPSADDIERLRAEVPRQEAGRCSASELVLSRANKSLRLFAHVVDRLAQGLQPDADQIAQTGYLMRTTAVYGNGKFGIADRLRIAGRSSLNLPFRVEMLCVWLIRGFSVDLAEHVARARNPDAARLAPKLRRFLGVGNATGLGMAPFLVNHPVLLNNWVRARETALARVRAIQHAAPEALTAFQSWLARAAAHIAEWTVADARQMQRIETLRAELGEAQALSTTDWLRTEYPWDRLTQHSTRWSAETQELLVALMLEPHGGLIDDLTADMGATAAPAIDPGQSCADLKAALDQHYGWMGEIDFDDSKARQRFWYVSAEKLEPRLGDRYAEPGAEKESPLDIAWQLTALAKALSNTPADQPIAELLMSRPDLRQVTARVQAAPQHPYAEIQGNLTAANCLPIDMLRCKLAFFGATKFDPKSDLWTRITLFQGAPSFDEIVTADPDAWALPFLQGDA